MAPDADIVIPVYNEGENIRTVLDAFKAALHFRARVFIGYDFEDDDTLTALADYDPAPLELVLVRNKGRGPLHAVVTALAITTAPCVITFPADDTFNAPRLNTLYRRFQDGHDIVAASRLMKGGTMERCPWLKAVLVRSGNFTMWALGRVPTRDSSSGLRLFSRRVIDQIPVKSTVGFAYSIELLVKAHRLGWPITEVPFLWRERTAGRSRFRPVRWLPQYLVWLFYALETTWLRRGPETVRLVNPGTEQNRGD